MDGKERKIANGSVSTPQVAFVDPGGPRAPLRSNFDDPEGWDISCSDDHCVQRDEVYRMAPVAGCPIIKCGKPGCDGFSTLSEVECGCTAGKKPATCRTCGKISPSPDIFGMCSRNATPAMSQAVVGPCAPSEPVSFSSGLDVTSLHAVTSGLSADSLDPVQDTSCVDRAVSHGFVGVMSVGKSGGKGTLQTSYAHLERSQPDVGTQFAHVGHPGVELVSRATYISRKKRNRETVWRQSKALKKAQREAKRKFVGQPEISHEAAEFILRNQSARTRNFLVSCTSATKSLCCMVTRTSFSAHSAVPSTLVDL